MEKTREYDPTYKPWDDYDIQTTDQDDYDLPDAEEEKAENQIHFNWDRSIRIKIVAILQKKGFFGRKTVGYTLMNEKTGSIESVSKSALLSALKIIKGSGVQNIIFTNATIKGRRIILAPNENIRRDTLMKYEVSMLNQANIHRVFYTE